MFWFQHPNVLFKEFELWPKENMMFNEKLNAISRLVILLTIIGFLYTQNMRFFSSRCSDISSYHISSSTAHGIK